ncbi:hypothetical protein GCM10023222_55770 [Saccharopolyspora cebuensis]
MWDTQSLTLRSRSSRNSSNRSRLGSPSARKNFATVPTSPPSPSNPPDRALSAASLMRGFLPTILYIFAKADTMMPEYIRKYEYDQAGGVRSPRKG